MGGSGWRHADTGAARLQLIVTQSLHWLAFVGAMWHHAEQLAQRSTVSAAEQLAPQTSWRRVAYERQELAQRTRGDLNDTPPLRAYRNRAGIIERGSHSRAEVALGFSPHRATRNRAGRMCRRSSEDEAEPAGIAALGWHIRFAAAWRIVEQDQDSVSSGNCGTWLAHRMRCRIAHAGTELASWSGSPSEMTAWIAAPWRRTKKAGATANSGYNGTELVHSRFAA